VVRTLSQIDQGYISIKSFINTCPTYS